MALFDAGLSIFGIRLYALCILLGIIVGVYMMIKEGKKIRYIFRFHLLWCNYYCPSCHSRC